ncbi:MAG: glycyl-radical enzyme activating protein [Calditrichia bacterium]|nr:glycyl-radical enzyme activating protein [Calditrichia bacterium]
MNSGIIFDIKRFAIHDGPGIRTTVFFKGCLANCWWCHNPESQAPEIQSVKKTNKLENLIFEEDEIVGRKITVNELFSEIKKDNVYFDESGGGVTFSGGEPLMQPEFLNSILKLCKNNDIHTTLDTTGHCSEDIIELIHNNVDLFLYDLKIIDDNLHQKYTGLSNEQILSNLKFLLKNKKNVIIRFPVIPGVMDTNTNVNQILKFLDSNNSISEINILPFHRIANHKYTRFQKENKMNKVKEPTQAEIIKVKKVFESAGFKVSVGG